MPIRKYNPTSPGRRFQTVQVAEPDTARAVDMIRSMLAVFENGMSTQVATGENRGRTLANDRIVTRLERVAKFDGRGVIEETVTVEPSPRQGIAAFLQDRVTKRIYAAAQPSS